MTRSIWARPAKDNVAWYGFNQRLAQEGYVVLNVDYPGSYGYGRDFRVGDYRDLGGGDAKDVVSGVSICDRWAMSTSIGSAYTG